MVILFMNHLLFCKAPSLGVCDGVLYIYVTVNVSNQSFGQMTEIFSHLVKCLWPPVIWPNA